MIKLRIFQATKTRFDLRDWEWRKSKHSSSSSVDDGGYGRDVP
jgi:hypothetical protein